MISKSDIINIAIRKTVKVCSKTANVFLSTSVFTKIYLFKFDHFLPKFCLHNCSHVTKRPQNCYVQSFYRCTYAVSKFELSTSNRFEAVND